MKAIRVFLVLLLCAPVSVSAEDGESSGAAGTLSLFVFLDGKPLPNVEISIEGKSSYRSDLDGYGKISLASGAHQVEVFGRDEAGRNLGYLKKTIEIKEGKDTQIVIRFVTGDAPLVTMDTPREGKERKDIESSGKAFLQGTVFSSETSKPIGNARVFVRGTSVDARTDEDGHYEVEVPAEVPISISIVHSEYASHTVDNVVLETDGRVTRDFVLSPASIELEEFVVLAPKVKGSISSIVAEEKTTLAVSNILSSEEIGKKGDSSAAGALKRVTGVTLVGGRDVYVRGLGQRYSNVEMNSMPLPSPNPLQKSVPLDIFPAGAIDSVKVQKSATADIPSSFGGGYIDIRTKTSSDEDFVKVSVEGKANTKSFTEKNTYEGSDTDFLGFDDGYREIDETILENSQVVEGQRNTAFTPDNYTEEELSRFTQDYVNRNYDVVKKNQLPGFGFGVEAAKSLPFSSKHHVTLFGNYKYSTDSESRRETYKKYNMAKGTGELYPDPIQYGNISNSMTEYVHNGMANIGYSYSNAFRVVYTKLWTHNAENVTRIVNGIMGSNDEDMTKYYLNWDERTLDVDQLTGGFDYELFANETNFSFGLEHAAAKLYQPNNYHYTFRNEGVPFLDHKISNNIANKLESDDAVFALFAKNKFHFGILGSTNFLELGASMSSKKRESRQYKFFLNKVGAGSIVDDHDMTGTVEDIYDTYVRPEIPYDERSLVLGQLFKAADLYDADVDETAVFVNAFSRPWSRMEILLGVRYVDFSQSIYQYLEDRKNPDMSKRRLIARVPTELTVRDFHPSAGVKLIITDDDVVDIGLSQTFIAPDLREFTEGVYFHPYEVATIRGNTELVNTDIYSVDLKYGHYFSKIENIKLGPFFKYLDNPIEDVMERSSSLPIYSFDNANYAVLYGLEIDGRKDFAFIHRALRNFYISGNFSYTKSEVTLTEEQETVYSSNKRELQGLSPIVINVTLGYGSGDRSVTLSYNKMWERIRKVGMIDDGDRYPDDHEDPAHLLDFVWIEKFECGIALKAKAGNILHGKTVWRQGDNVTKEYRKPTTFSLGLSYTYN